MSEQGILDSLQQPTDVPTIEDEDDSEERPAPPTTNEALKMIQGLKYYVMSDDTIDESFMHHFCKFETALTNKLTHSKKQATITDFFKR